MQPTTPRRSNRISQQSLAVGPVGSYKSGYTYYWPESPLPSSQVKYYPKPNDREGKWVTDYYSTIHRQHTASDRSEMLRIGDIVLVNTRRTSYPSIGVIVAMWQVRTVEGNAIDGKDGSPRVRVHWFVQPSEMARVRAHRDHSAVCNFIPSRENGCLKLGLRRTKYTIL
jgi:origin recognition complex subunit 1